MDYRTHLKYLMTRGQAVKLKGQGIVGMGAGIPKMQLQNYRGTGTISHRAVVDRAMNAMNNLNISGSGARKKDYTPVASKPKKTKGSGNNFKSLKFNF